MANTNMEIVFEVDKVYKILELFDLIDLYDLLKEHNITEESLKFMQSSHINELFPKELLGRKIIFEQRLKEWQIEQGVRVEILSFPSESTTPGSGSTESISSSFLGAVNDLNEISLLGILKSNVNGNAVLNYFENNQSLSTKTRKLLCSSITEYLIYNKIKPTRFYFSNLADKIIQLFPKESKDTYYLYKKCKKPSGNLYAHYHNSIYKLRKAEVSVNPEPAKLRSSLSLNLDKNLNTDLYSNENEAKYWLKNNIEPYDKVVEYWNVTYETRQKFFNSTITTNDILIEWPILKQQFGYCLIELDFEKKYPLKSNCLLEEWDNLVTKLIPRFNNYAKDKYGLQLLEKLTTNIDKNARDVIVSLLLHSMLKPTHRKKNKKTTLFESREAFLIHAATRQELQHKILEGINKCKAGETVQPHLCGIGEDDINLTQFYIFFANSYYKVGNFVKSIDVCLKLFATLDLEYPAECKQVWEFLAKYFFNLTHENLSCVSSLISDLS